jgi:1-acyl-sn-glycerol-3-phosphate acyltransferase
MREPGHDAANEDAEAFPLPERDLERADRWLYQPLRTLLALGYFRLEVTGLEHVPRQGAVIFVANHAGWLPLDALFLSLVLHDRLGPAFVPYIAVHELVLRIPGFSPLARSVGLFPAEWLNAPERLPEALRHLLIFPEGEAGNFKPVWQAYRMREWHCGFIHAAFKRRAQVVPVMILGGEESAPVALSLPLEGLIGTILPLPLTPLPLPARWKLAFLPPLDVAAYAEHEALEAHDPRHCHLLAAGVGPDIQAALDHESADRPLARLVRRLHGIRD